MAIFHSYVGHYQRVFFLRLTDLGLILGDAQSETQLPQPLLWDQAAKERKPWGYAVDVGYFHWGHAIGVLGGSDDPLLIKAGWKINEHPRTEWRCIARKITDFYGPWLPSRG